MDPNLGFLLRSSEPSILGSLKIRGKRGVKLGADCGGERLYIYRRGLLTLGFVGNVCELCLVKFVNFVVAWAFCVGVCVIVALGNVDAWYPACPDCPDFPFLFSSVSLLDDLFSNPESLSELPIATAFLLRSISRRTSFKLTVFGWLFDFKYFLFSNSYVAKHRDGRCFWTDDMTSEKLKPKVISLMFINEFWVLQCWV